MNKKQRYAMLIEIYDSLAIAYNQKKTSFVYVSLVALHQELKRLYKSLADGIVAALDDEEIIVPPPPPPDPPEPEEGV